MMPTHGQNICVIVVKYDISVCMYFSENKVNINKRCYVIKFEVVLVPMFFGKFFIYKLNFNPVNNQ